MPIVQVSHFNHVDEQPADAQPVAPAEPLAALAAAEARLGAKKYFVRNPKLVKDDAVAFQRNLEWGRNVLDGGARVAQAEQWKAEANNLFAAGKSHAALMGYLVGIWHLRRGRPACPMVIAHAVATAKDDEAEFSTAGIGEVAAWLQAAPAADDAGSERLEDDSAPALRISLHLNAAAAALKLCAWPAAKAAGRQVSSPAAS